MIKHFIQYVSIKSHFLTLKIHLIWEPSGANPPHASIRTSCSIRQLLLHIPDLVRHTNCAGKLWHSCTNQNSCNAIQKRTAGTACCYLWVDTCILLFTTSRSTCRKSEHSLQGGKSPSLSGDLLKIQFCKPYLLLVITPANCPLGSRLTKKKYSVIWYRNCKVIYTWRQLLLLYHRPEFGFSASS